jgi:Tol biopolymer transport system component
MIVLLPGIDAEPVMLRLTNANHVSFGWYPDGDKIAVAISGHAGGYGLGVFRTDEPNIEPVGLVTSRGYVAAIENPSVSPDGTKVAFELWRLDGPENKELLGIGVLPAAPDTPIDLRKSADVAKVPLAVKGRAKEPRWSPDGKRILYSLAGSGGRDIWVANADGANPINLTKGKGDNYDAAWAPTGRKAP